MPEKERAGKVTATSLNAVKGFSLAGTAVTATAAQLNQAASAMGTVAFDRSLKVAIVPLVGATIQGGVQAWANPEAGDILIGKVEVDVTTVAGQAGTLSAGTTAASATTASQNLIDTLDVRTAAGVFDNITDKGSLGKSRQRIAAGKWVTFKSQSGDLTGLVGNLYISYHSI